MNGCPWCELYTNNCNLFAVVFVSPEANEISFPRINCRRNNWNGAAASVVTTRVLLLYVDGQVFGVEQSRQKWINLMRSITRTSGKKSNCVEGETHAVFDLEAQMKREEFHFSDDTSTFAMTPLISRYQQRNNHCVSAGLGTLHTA